MLPDPLVKDLDSPPLTRGSVYMGSSLDGNGRKPDQFTIAIFTIWIRIA